MSGVTYPVDTFEEPLYTLLVNCGLAEVTHEDYEVLAQADPETLQQYLEACAADPESYPWDSVIYTLRGGEEEEGEGEEATAEAEAAEGGEEGEGEYEYAEGEEAPEGEAEEEGEHYEYAEGEAEEGQEGEEEEGAYEEGQEEEGGEEEEEGAGEGGVEDVGEDEEEEEVHRDDDAEGEQEEGNPAREQNEIPEGAWQCTRCTYVNPEPDTTICAVCRVSRHCEEDTKSGHIDKNNEGKVQLTMSSVKVANNRYLRGQFRVVKFNSDSLFVASTKKERIFEVDFFKREFKNCDTNGKVSFELASANLYRVERDLNNQKTLKLLFFKAQHPIDLIFESATHRQRFMELAALQRKSPILWAPSFCRQHAKETVVKIEGKEIEHKGKSIPVEGQGTFVASRMPYEVIRLWTGTFNLQNRGLPPVSPKLEEFMAPQHDVYVIGLQDVPPTLRDGKQITDFFTQYFGQNFYMLMNTMSDTNVFAGIEGKKGDKHPPACLVVVVRRSVLGKVGNIDYFEMMEGSGKKNEAPDMYAVFFNMRIQESFCAFMLMNITPNISDVNERNLKLQSVLAKIKCGDQQVDVSVRYEYFFLIGSLGYATIPSDELHAQIAGQTILTEFQECTILAEMCLADRVMFWHRPRSARATILAYSTATLGSPNIGALFDLFVQRPYIYAISPEVPMVKIQISSIRFICDTLPPVKDPEVHIVADWFENSPRIVPLKFSSQKYHTTNVPPLTPVCPAYEYLRAQSVMFSLYGQADGITKKKDMIASSVIPLRDLLIPDKPLEHAVFVLRQTVVIGLMETTVTYMTRK